jgi:hypothetical protein
MCVSECPVEAIYECGRRAMHEEEQKEQQKQDTTSNALLTNTAKSKNCKGCPKNCSAKQTNDTLCLFPISYTYHPNPANEELTITFGDLNPNVLQNQTSSVTYTFDIKLFNKEGRQVRQASWNTNHPSKHVHFDLRRLQKGTYYLHLESEGQVKKEQIIIQ